MRTYVVASLLALGACQAQDLKRLLDKELPATLSVKSPTPLRLQSRHGTELSFQDQSFHQVLVSKKNGLKITLNPRGGNPILLSVPESAVKIEGESLWLTPTRDHAQGYTLRGRAIAKHNDSHYKDSTDCDGSDLVTTRHHTHNYQTYFIIHLSSAEGHFEEAQADAQLDISTGISTEETQEVLSRAYSGWCLAASIAESIGDAISDD